MQSLIMIKINSGAGHMACLHNFSLNLEGKSPLGRPRNIWMNIINMDFKVIEWDVTDMTETSGRHL